MGNCSKKCYDSDELIGSLKLYKRQLEVQLITCSKFRIKIYIKFHNNI
jgi:hypothetical protein